jgi:hypothetical protein
LVRVRHVPKSFGDPDPISIRFLRLDQKISCYFFVSRIWVPVSP